MAVGVYSLSYANQRLKDAVDYRRDESSSDFTQKPQGALRPRKGRQALRSLREKTELWNTLKRFRAKHAKQPQSTQSLRGLCVKKTDSFPSNITAKR